MNEGMKGWMVKCEWSERRGGEMNGWLNVNGGMNG